MPNPSTVYAEEYDDDGRDKTLAICDNGELVRPRDRLADSVPGGSSDCLVATNVDTEGQSLDNVNCMEQTTHISHPGEVDIDACLAAV